MQPAEYILNHPLFRLQCLSVTRPGVLDRPQSITLLPLRRPLGLHLSKGADTQNLPLHYFPNVRVLLTMLFVISAIPVFVAIDM